jgi:glycosyltransferase involved in cell wall biosynthesis
MRIAIVDPPHGTRGGDWYYRAYLPGKALAALDGVRVVYLQNHHRRRREVLQEADLVVLNAVVDADLLPVIAARRLAGRPTLYEINDDFRGVQATNPIAGFFADPANRRLLFRTARSCDALQFSTPELQRLYGHFGETNVVFPNQLAGVPPARSRRPGDRVVIGWGGSNGHLEDVREVAPALVRFLRDRPGVVLRVMGAREIAGLFDGLPRGQVAHVRPGTIQAYHAFVDTLDIGIGPLRDEAFNRSRSDVKFLEYASHGVIPVMRRLAPYVDSVQHGHNGYLYETPDELVAWLARLVDDPGLREQLSRDAYAAVAHSRLQSRFADTRLAFYQDIARRVGWVARPPDEEEAFAARVRSWDGAEVEGRLTLLGATRFETLVHDALALGPAAPQRAALHQLLREASALEPEDPLPWLLRGAWAGETSALERAVALAPRSVVCRMADGHRWAQSGDLRGLQRFLEAAELAPTYEAPYLAAAALMERLGMQAEAHEFLGHANQLVQGLHAL